VKLLGERTADAGGSARHKNRVSGEFHWGPLLVAGEAYVE
jgi:hypothetical protein